MYISPDSSATPHTNVQLGNFDGQADRVLAYPGTAHSAGAGRQIRQPSLVLLADNGASAAQFGQRSLA